MDAINGHFEIMEKSRPIEKVINDNRSGELVEKLENFQKARKFATEQLLLPDNDSYKEYSDIGRSYAVWNVVAAPEDFATSSSGFERCRVGSEIPLD